MDSFFTLTPDRILDAVEDALGREKTGVRATGFALPLNSVENRVYEIGMDDNSSVVTKFYRPGRWSQEQILEEHRFIQKLHDNEIPVVPPKVLHPSGSTLQESKDGILFAVFPKVRGRLLDELDDAQVRQIGRYLARIHAIGESLGPSVRIPLNVQTYAERPLALLLNSPFLDAHSRSRYEPLVKNICDAISPLFERVPVHRVHGDCHPGNTLWTADGKSFLVDFDDCVVAPAVQDLWMVVRGRDEAALKQREELIQAYEVFREFDRSQLKLIEPLRALRMIHYSGWIAQRWNDPSFPRMFPNFGTQPYWQEEIEELGESLSLIQSGGSVSTEY